jgi:glycosyltransferase involved in cell wall biosynthesis
VNRPLITCVVPVFNGERYLRSTLDSMLGQTYTPVEVIVADDGSTDGTPAVVDSYDGRVRYVRQPNTGHGAARNLGLDAARGELVAFLDADDLWHPEKLERQMARFQARPELEACVTFVQNFWSPELTAAKAFPEDPVPGYRSVSLLARRALFETVGHFDPALRHGNDTEWFIRVAEHGAVVELISDVLVYRRLHEANRSTRLAANSRKEYLRIVKAALDRRRGA